MNREFILMLSEIKEAAAVSYIDSCFFSDGDDDDDEEEEGCG